MVHHPRPPVLRRRLIAMLALLLPALAAADAAAQGPPAQVRVSAVEDASITLASRLVATVEPIVVTTLAAQEPALLQERFFDEGDEVEPGFVMARQDDALLRLQQATAEAAVRTAEAQLNRARLEAARLEREQSRIGDLYARGVATERENLDAINDFEQAVAAAVAAEAQLAERRASVALLALQVERHTIEAPFAGVVNRRFVEVGQWIRQGDAVAELVQLDPLFVRTSVPEGVVSRIRRGDVAGVAVDALGGQQFEGTIDQILPVADPESRTFSVRLRVENADRLLRPGMFARVTLRQKREGELVVPKDAVVNQAGRTHVVAVQMGEGMPSARLVPVVLGAAEGERQAVRPVEAGALAGGTLVVIRGNEALAPGQGLIVQNPPGPPSGPPPGPPSASAQPPAP